MTVIQKVAGEAGMGERGAKGEVEVTGGTRSRWVERGRARAGRRVVEIQRRLGQ
jgi:hypothetical protein